MRWLLCQQALPLALQLAWSTHKADSVPALKGSFHRTFDNHNAPPLPHCARLLLASGLKTNTDRHCLPSPSAAADPSIAAELSKKRLRATVFFPRDEAFVAFLEKNVSGWLVSTQLNGRPVGCNLRSVCSCGHAAVAALPPHPCLPRAPACMTRSRARHVTLPPHSSQPAACRA